MNETPLTPDERDRVLEAITTRIHKYRLETPAIFFLEMNRPLAGIAGLAAHAVTPLFGAFTGMDNAERYAALLGDREALDSLLDRLDESRRDRTEPNSGADAPRTGTPTQSSGT